MGTRFVKYADMYTQHRHNFYLVLLLILIRLLGYRRTQLLFVLFINDKSTYSKYLPYADDLKLYNSVKNNIVNKFNNI